MSLHDDDDIMMCDIGKYKNGVGPQYLNVLYKGKKKTKYKMKPIKKNGGCVTKWCVYVSLVEILHGNNKKKPTDIDRAFSETTWWL